MTSVGQPDDISASLRKQVCSLQDDWNLAWVWAQSPPGCAKDSNCSAPSSTPPPPSPLPLSSPLAGPSSTQRLPGGANHDLSQRTFGTRWTGIIHPCLYEMFVTELRPFHYEMFVE